MIELLIAVTSNDQSQPNYTDMLALMDWKFELTDEVLTRVLNNCQKLNEKDYNLERWVSQIIR